MSTDGNASRHGSPEAHGLREGRLSERLAVVLAADIVSRRLAAGDPFPSTQEIVTRFDVSRIVAREAVQALQMLGLVHVQHGKRTEVLPPHQWAILSRTVQNAMRQEQRTGELLAELYDMRLLLEPAAAAWMAERGTDEQVDQLDVIAERMADLAEQERVMELLAADREFHDLISAASGNRILTAVVRDLRELIDNVWGLSAIGPHNAKTVSEHHVAIARAIGQRDPSGAHQTMTAHLQWATEADVPAPGVVAAPVGAGNSDG